MIDVDSEKIITISQAAKRSPGRPNITTVWRWRNRGVRGVRLETIRVGGRRFTSEEALQRFHDRVTAAADGEPVVANQTLRQREAAIDRAERELARMGV